MEHAHCPRPQDISLAVLYAYSNICPIRPAFPPSPAFIYPTSSRLCLRNVVTPSFRLSQCALSASSPRIELKNYIIDPLPKDYYILQLGNWST